MNKKSELNKDNLPPGVPKEVDILDEDYTEYLDWTIEEEEKFSKIFNKTKNYD